jgi:hypothetical protein
VFIYLDEAGTFIEPNHGDQLFSLVGALVVPEQEQQELLYQFLRIRDAWPNPQIEVKGSALTAPQASEVISLLAKHNAILVFVAVDMATHSAGTIEELKERQAAAVTQNLTPAHQPKVASQLHALADRIRALPNQLFLQAILTIRLVFETIQTTTLYYVQRMPRELESFKWVIDRKDRSITEMEALWTSLILPFSESRFATEPLRRLRGADYSYFERFQHTSSPDEETARHIAWLRDNYGVEKASSEGFGDARKLLAEHRKFADSRENLGVQLVDIVTTTLRRALHNRLEQEGWEGLAQLQIRSNSVPFLQLGNPEGKPVQLEGQAARVWRTLSRSAKEMWV